MLNELSQVADSLERLVTVAPSRHPRINPMGKNRDLLVVSLDGAGNPSLIEVLPGETAANLFRVEHGSAGSSFPGFNIPTPLRRLDEASPGALKPAVEKLLAVGKNRNSSAAEIKESIHTLFTLSQAQTFGPVPTRDAGRAVSAAVEAALSDVPGGVGAAGSGGALRALKFPMSAFQGVRVCLHLTCHREAGDLNKENQLTVKG